MKEFLIKHPKLPSFVRVEKLTEKEEKECSLMPGNLAKGEREAIILAKRFNAPLLIDDQKARKEAARHDVKTLGACSVIRKGFIICFYEQDEFDTYRLHLTQFLYTERPSPKLSKKLWRKEMLWL